MTDPSPIDGQEEIYVSVLIGNSQSIMCYGNSSNTSWSLQFENNSISLNDEIVPITNASNITLNDGSSPDSNSNLTIVNFTSMVNMIQLTCTVGNNTAKFILGIPGLKYMHTYTMQQHIICFQKNKIT